MTQDMTKGHPLKTIAPFFFSMTIAQLFTHMYGFVDTAIVSRWLGDNALAAVGSTGSINFLFTGFVSCLPSSLTIITGQRFGAKDADGMRRSVCVSLVVTLISSIIMTLGSVLFIDDLLVLMKTPEAIYEDTYCYIFTVMLGIPASSFYFLFSSMMRALGDSRRPVYVIICSSILNVCLDLLFICKCGWGIAGAAWATVIAQMVSAVVCMGFIVFKMPELHPTIQSWNNKFKLYWEHLYVSVPIAIQFTIMGSGATIVQTAVNKFGEEKVAAIAAGSRLYALIWIPIGALGMAVTAYTAQNYGARNFRRIRSGVSICWRAAIAFSLVFGLLIYLFKRPLLGIFLDSGQETEGIIIAGEQYLNRVAPFFISLSMIVIYRSALQGMGHTLPPLIGGIVETICRLITAFYLARHFGYIGVCYNEGLVCTSNGLLLFAVYLYIMWRYDHPKNKPRNAPCEPVSEMEAQA